MTSSPFESVGTEPGVQTWRIDSLHPLPVPSDGKFWSSDAYIVLHSRHSPAQHSSPSPPLTSDVYCWLGAASTRADRDAAVRAAERLDAQLGGACVCHREMQQYESAHFLRLWRPIEYVDAAVATRRQRAERGGIFETRLLRVFGAQEVRVVNVPLRGDSLNECDVFVLDTGNALMQWNGKASTRKERSKAAQVCTQIKDDREGRPKLKAFGQGDEPVEFWLLLGGAPRVIAKQPPLLDEGCARMAARDAARLLRVGDNEREELAVGGLSHSMLRSDGVYLVDLLTEVFVWVGRHAAAEASMRWGIEYCVEERRPEWTRVVKVVEGNEPLLLTHSFAAWDPEEGGSGTPSEKERWAALRSVDDRLAVWRVEGEREVEMPAAHHGAFFEGNAYVLRHTHAAHGKDIHVLYVWRGARAGQKVGEVAESLAAKMNERLGGVATQVLVTMGEEPDAFVVLFRGEMVIFKGSHTATWAQVRALDVASTGGDSLYRVDLADGKSSRVMQVDLTSASLDSNDAFLLLTPSASFVWIGRLADDAKLEAARALSLRREDTPTDEVHEGAEPPAFWLRLGGKAAYATARRPPRHRPPVLHQLCRRGDVRWLEATPELRQSELEAEEAYLLEADRALFVWVGRECDEDARPWEPLAASHRHAQGYSIHAPIIRVRAGLEPTLFTAHFASWDAGGWYADAPRQSFGVARAASVDGAHKPAWATMRLRPSSSRLSVDAADAADEPSPLPSPRPTPRPTPRLSAAEGFSPPARPPGGATGSATGSTVPSATSGTAARRPPLLPSSSSPAVGRMRPLVGMEREGGGEAAIEFLSARARLRSVSREAVSAASSPLPPASAAASPLRLASAAASPLPPASAAASLLPPASAAASPLPPAVLSLPAGGAAAWSLSDARAPPPPSPAGGKAGKRKANVGLFEHVMSFFGATPDFGGHRAAAVAIQAAARRRAAVKTARARREAQQMAQREEAAAKVQSLEAMKTASAAREEAEAAAISIQRDARRRIARRQASARREAATRLQEEERAQEALRIQKRHAARVIQRSFTSISERQKPVGSPKMGDSSASLNSLDLRSPESQLSPQCSLSRDVSSPDLSASPEEQERLRLERLQRAKVVRDQVKRQLQHEKDAALEKARQIREAKEEAAALRAKAVAEEEQLLLSRPLHMRGRRWPHRWKVKHVTLDEEEQIVAVGMPPALLSSRAVSQGEAAARPGSIRKVKRAMSWNPGAGSRMDGAQSKLQSKTSIPLSQITGAHIVDEGRHEFAILCQSREGGAAERTFLFRAVDLPTAKLWLEVVEKARQKAEAMRQAKIRLSRPANDGLWVT